MRRTLPFTISTMLIAGVSMAGASAARADVKTDCAPDVKSYCSGIEPKGGKLRDCMAENRAKLSNSCKLAVADRKLEMDAKRAAGKKSGSGLAPKSKDDDE